MKILKTMAVLMLITVLAVGTRAQGDPAEEDNLVYITAVAWSHDASKIVAVGIQSSGAKGYFHVIDVQTGETIYQLDPSPGGFTSVAWSPDDRFIAAGGFDQVVWIIDIKNRTHAMSLGGHRSTVSAVDWSTDGTRLVSAGNWDELVILWDMITYKQIRLVETSDVWTVAYSPNNQKIAVGGGGGLSIFPSTLDVGLGKEQNPYRYFTTLSIGSLAWSHDGSRIAFGTQTFPSIINPDLKSFAQLHIVDGGTGTQLNSISTEDEAIFDIDWSRDDSLIATYSSNGFVRVWDANAGTQLENFPAFTRYPIDISFSPYGGRLAYGGSVSPEAALTNTPQISAQNGSQLLGGGAIQIVVPAPSAEKLQAITQACGVQPSVQQTLTAQIITNKLQDFTTQVSALTDAQIPPGCKADLLAVANALLAKGQ